mmetsp:Transcript_15877/g.62034  ORF Transcript_15877/g.62034 Transcript_15877/m.62034 type:complete len:219 (+) Transcript_15877:39-695(+)|eukprot:CAMPEP_0114609178 /NCGR_PEP_ID=MMETSP0168-20121206/2956_1 /TAXON_ID=95228 ORGANISM="Vannella sp., Strain DIVA3 517/6/12" /NCGR_SAMPLE_ID=MMETSP0168 /ASSEMBLY_ACC=CAM_ASM_000044 /LENGTH=218 /DNA_ID=CAMNT_0001820091 /DNA_START=26 /DNA_END=682 /DNA_ORIENTATION=+
MSSKLSNEHLNEVVAAVLKYATETKKRGFVETVELQIGLKNYDPQRDKRFSGTIRLPKPCKPRMKFCIFGDQVHCDKAQEIGIDFRDIEMLKTFKRNKKLVKKLASQYDAFLASESMIRQIPKLLGPGLNKAGKFPTLVTHNESLEQKMFDVRCTVKFQMKKVLCLAVAVGSVDYTHDELVANIQQAVNFLVSLLKKHWQNVRSLYLKSSMGPPHRLY